MPALFRTFNCRRAGVSGFTTERVASTFFGKKQMAEGTIKKLTDKGFGFIDKGDGTDIFFHLSCLVDVQFEQLHEGQRVSFNEGEGPKGTRAEDVRPLD